MAIFLPIRTPNAIDQAVFVVKLSERFAETHVEALKPLEQELSEEFTNFHEVTLQGVVLSADGITTHDNRIIGVECNTPVHSQDHLLNNERTDWILRIVEDSIQINCLNYTSWEESIDYVDKLLAKVFKCLPTDEVMISGINFQVNDIFVVQDSIEDTDYSQLFNHSKYLTENTWNVGVVWHVNSGWFDSAEHDRTLNVLNIATQKDVSESVNLMVKIEHLQQYVMDAWVPLNVNEDFPVVIFKQLHEGNKVIVNELLTSDIKNKIGLS